jgi:NAD(P)-dependent dehydrogenase (short-subunit alcohol dehydrogenase family)
MHGQVTMSGRLKGKVSLVTGGELGAATAKALAEQGATFNSLRA